VEFNVFGTHTAKTGVSRRSFIGSASGLAAAMLGVNQITGMRSFEVSETEAYGQPAGQDFMADAQRADVARWIAAPLHYTTGVPFQLGYGTKHVQGCWCGPQFPNSILLVAGDWDKPPQPQSYRNEVFIYDLVTHTQTQVFPPNGAYYGPPGTQQPCNPDEMCVAWDPGRGRAYVWPGTQAYSGAYDAPHPGGGIARFNLMTFHLDGPNRYTYQNPSGNVPGTGEERPLQGVYDPVTDKLYCMRSGGAFYEFPAALMGQGGRWTTTNLTGAITRGNFTQDGCAIVPTGPHRGVYHLDSTTSNLWKVNPESKATRLVCTFPKLAGASCPSPARLDLNRMVHSPNSNRIYVSLECDWKEPLPHPQYPNATVPTAGFPTVYYWDLTAQTIGVLPTTTPSGDRIRGNHTFIYCGAPHYKLFLAGGFPVGLDGQHHPACNPYPFVAGPGGSALEIHKVTATYFYQEDVARADRTPPSA